MKALLFAAALAALPTLSHSATFTTIGIDGDFAGPVDIIGPVGQIDGTVGGFFSAVFEDSDVEQALRFDIRNDTSAVIKAQLRFLFIGQCDFSCGFAGLSDDPETGVRIESSLDDPFLIPTSFSFFAEGVIVDIDPGDFFVLDFEIGDPFVIGSGPSPLIEFFIAPIPLPASSLLLLGGLGAFGALRRRK